jgi:hypothetical protein
MQSGPFYFAKLRAAFEIKKFNFAAKRYKETVVKHLRTGIALV